MNIAAVLRMRWMLSTLLIVGGALFVVGIAAERNAGDHNESGATTHTEEGGEGDEHAEDATAIEPTHDESSEERVLGMNVESPLLVSLVVAVSLALAVLTWRSNMRLVLLAAAGFAAVFAVFDIAELLHQVDESRTGIAVLVGVIAVVHAAAALVAERRVGNQTA